MASKKARITLVGPLSYSVGRYRFQKDRPVVTEDAELIKYVELDPQFKVEMLEEAVAAKAPAAPSKPETTAAMSEQPKTEAASEEVEEVKAAPAKAAPPSKLARKNENKKETAHETD